MVVSLGPGKFYGTSLPRPRFYTDVQFNDHRVDPPVPVTDPLMSWAHEAHWSMGGLSFNRLRLQGKIEGNVNKLRSQLESQSDARARSPLPPARSNPLRGSKRPAPDSPPPPPAPVAAKRRRLIAMIEEGKEEEEMEEEGKDVRVKDSKRGVRRRLVKKLGDDFDRVASENEGNDASDRAGPNAGSGGSDPTAVRTRRSRRLVKGGEAVMMKVVDGPKKRSLDPKGKKSSKSGEGEKSPNANGVRTSPRLAKSRSN